MSKANAQVQTARNCWSWDSSPRCQGPDTLSCKRHCPLACSVPTAIVYGPGIGWTSDTVTQGSNPGLPHCRQILHPLSHQGRLQTYKSQVNFHETEIAEHLGWLDDLLRSFSPWLLECLSNEPMNRGPWGKAMHGPTLGISFHQHSATYCCCWLPALSVAETST